jgi:hypothetical protein
MIIHDNPIFFAGFSQLPIPTSEVPQRTLAKTEADAKSRCCRLAKADRELMAWTGLKDAERFAM